LSHLASAFLVSPFEDAAIASVDGFGDFLSTMVGRGQGNRIEILDQQLARKAVALRKQFASLQQALNAIVAQQTFLNRFLGGTGSLFGG
jgi:predicted NodU family carbamoyl transferase